VYNPKRFSFALASRKLGEKGAGGPARKGRDPVLASAPVV
jgi:hypothetical protein